MKKYFMTVATVALFAIGFAASDEEESSNSSSSSSAPQTEQKQETEQQTNKQKQIEQTKQSEQVQERTEVKEEVKLFQPGNSYISNEIKNISFPEATKQYELSLYNDGTFELLETHRDNGNVTAEYEFEGKWDKKTESRKDVLRTWYEIRSDHAKNDTKHGMRILVDENGKIFFYNGRSAHEAVGGDCEGTFRKK